MNASTIKAASDSHWVAIDTNCDRVYGTGSTPDQAMEMAVEFSEHTDNIKIYPATAELVALVESGVTDNYLITDGVVSIDPEFF